MLLPCQLILLGRVKGRGWLSVWRVYVLGWGFWGGVVKGSQVEA
jgi:hypothetical protein